MCRATQLRPISCAALRQFNQGVRIRAIVIKSTGDAAQRPRRIKLFVNRPTIGFEDAQDATEPEAAQIMELTDEQLVEGKRIPLRFVRFQNVTTLTVRKLVTTRYALAEHTCRSSLRRTAEMSRRVLTQLMFSGLLLGTWPGMRHFLWGSL